MSLLKYYLLITMVILSSVLIVPVIAGESELPKNWEELADSLEKEKKYDEAIEIYDQAISAYPDKDYAARQKGIFLTRIEQYTDALIAFEKARDINSDNVLTWQNIGAVNAQLGRYDEAIEAFHTLLDMDEKGWWETYGDIGIILDKQKKYEEAIEMFDKVLSEDPDDYDIYSLKANTYVHLGEDEKALTTYQEGLSRLENSEYRDSNENLDDYWGDDTIHITAGSISW